LRKGDQQLYFDAGERESEIADEEVREAFVLISRPDRGIAKEAKKKKRRPRIDLPPAKGLGGDVCHSKVFGEKGKERGFSSMTFLPPGNARMAYFVSTGEKGGGGERKG